MIFLVSGKSSYTILQILWDGSGHWEKKGRRVFLQIAGFINSLLKFRKYWLASDARKQITVIYVSGPRQFWLIVSRGLAILSKSSSGIRPFSASHLPELLVWEYNVITKKVIFRGRTIPACRQPEFIGIFKLTCRGLKNACTSLRLDKAITVHIKTL